MIDESTVARMLEAIGNMVPKNNIVSGEPSLGTLHYRASQYSAELYTNTAPAAGTFYTVTISNLPAGTRLVEIVGYIYGSSGDQCVWRPYGSADTFAQSTHRRLAQMATLANGEAHIHSFVSVDSSGRFDIAVGAATTDIHIYGWSFYSL